MSQSFFQFKKFRIEQAGCAMKVSTDACIQGAWTPVASSVKNVLDIGTGTGLLSLMLAQRCESLSITAIEIDPFAARQAEENIGASPWKNSVHVVEGDVTHYSFFQKFDLIICNPPFFKDSLLSEKKERNLARHNVSLSLEELCATIESHVTPEGYVSVLLPVAEYKIWKNILSRKGWKIYHELQIIPREGKAANRIVSLCCRISTAPLQTEHLIIRNLDNEYTTEFSRLLKSFYLKL